MKNYNEEMVYLPPEVALLANFYNHPSNICTYGFNFSQPRKLLS